MEIAKVSITVEKLLDHINQWNKKAKEAGMDLAAYVESVKAKSEETDETEVYDYSTHSYRRGCRYSDRTEMSDKNGTNNYSTKY